MNLSLHLLAILFSAPFILNFDLNSRQKTVKLYRLLGKCRKYPKPHAYLDGVKLIQEKSLFRIKLRVVIKKPSGNNLKLKFTLQRCQSKDALDTCEQISPIIIGEVCNYIARNQSVLAPVIKSFVPPLQCPFKPGTYVSENGSLNAAAIQLFPVTGHYWKTEMLFIDPDQNDKVTTCSYGEWQLIYL